MSQSNAIVIPYTSVETLHTFLGKLLQSQSISGGSITLQRIITAREQGSELSEKLYAEFKALQASAQQYDCGFAIEVKDVTASSRRTLRWI